jgi:hypothetical protein
MTTVVVGGHSRTVGKTSVAAGLIQAFNQYPWTAVKITSHRHGSLPASGNEEIENICNIYEEVSREGVSDTSRFLAAGAARALWVQVKDDPSGASLQPLLPILQSCSFVMIESNRILRVIQPDLFIMVLRYDVEDFKNSARRALNQADAVVAVNATPIQHPWKEISPETLSSIPQFATTDPKIIPVGLINFIRARLPR